MPVGEERQTVGDVPPLSLCPRGSEPQAEFLHETLEKFIFLDEANDVFHYSPEILLLHSWKLN